MTHTWPHWAWLLGALLLFAIALLSSGYSVYLQRRGLTRREEELQAQIDNKAAEIQRLAKGHEGEIAHKDSFVADASKEALALKKQVQEKDAQMAALAPFTLSPLQRQAFECAQRLREWIAAVGPLATPPLIAGESEEGRERRTQSARAAYRARLRFQYESEYRDEVRAIYRRFAIEDIRDLWIEQLLERVEHNEQALNIADGLEALAIRQFSPTASRLLERQLRPLNEAIEL